MTPIGSKINDSQKRKIGLPWFVFSNHQSLTSPPNSTPASPAKTAIIPEICAITLLLLHQVLISKSEKIQSEVIEFSSKLIDILGTKRSNANSNVMTNKNQEAA